MTYLLDSVLLHLTGEEEEGAPQGQAPEEGRCACGAPAVAQWQLRFLVLSALRKVFEYDTGAAFLRCHQVPGTIKACSGFVHCRPTI